MLSAQVPSKSYLVDLAESRRGKFLHNGDALRCMDGAFSLLDVTNQCLRFDSATSPQDDCGNDGCAPVIIGNPDDSCHGDRCVISERVLHFPGIDVETAGDDQIL